MEPGQSFASEMQVDLTKLTIQQLNQLKGQLDQELSVFQDSLSTLKMAQGKFNDSGECLKRLTPDTLDKQIMVPLTGSMYVPGQIKDVETVMIDIGTGYYARKDIKSALDYFKRKTEFVTEQMEKIQALGLDKSKIRDTIMDVMEMKLAANKQKEQS